MSGRRAWATTQLESKLDPATRFNPVDHTYFLNDEQVPSITQMLDDCMYIDDRYYTEECASRGTWVHTQCAAYDIGGIEEPKTLETPDDWTKDWKNYVLAYVKAMGDLGRPKWAAVERAFIHPTLRFGGRPDRVGKLWNAVSVLDLKTGGVYDWHGIQLALQAILIAPDYRLPPTSIVRYGLNVKVNGKFSLVEHKSKSDFDKAYEVIRRCTRPR